MQRVLVPTDFSDCAGYATEFAVGLAKKFDAEIYFYTQVNVHPRWTRLSEEGKKYFPESYEIVEKVRASLEALKNEYPEIKIHCHYSYGYLISEIEDYVKEKEIDLIIMGSHGSKGVREWLIGSNTQKVVRFSSIPVLVIKKPTTEIEFDNVVFASNFDHGALLPFERLLQIIDFCDTHLHLLAIETPRLFKEPSVISDMAIYEFVSLCPQNNCTQHFLPDLTVKAGIKKFVNEINADMLVMAVPRKRLVEQIFWYSTLEAIVNHIELPLLVFKY